MPWLLLTLAGLLEIVWAVSMKYSNGFTRLGPSVLTIVTMLASFALLAKAMKDLPAGTTYAVWVGIGAVGVAIYGMVFLKEPLTAARVACIALILIGVVGMKVVTPTSTNASLSPTPLPGP